MTRTYEGFFTNDFQDGLSPLSGLRKQIRKKVDAILLDRYYNTDLLGRGRWADLRGLRSKRVNRKIRIIFLIGEETFHPDCAEDKHRILFSDRRSPRQGIQEAVVSFAALKSLHITHFTFLTMRYSRPESCCSFRRCNSKGL